MNTDADDYMRLAINLAKKGMGYVSPNPLVGAVVLKNGRIAGIGYHHKFGDIHAEIDAINNCSGIDLEGAELIINLEPCSHHGKQPPCSDAIIEKKFSNVVIGMKDPNPKVSGNGIARLNENGINVTLGVLEEECKWLNRFFIKHIQTGQPYIIAKIAQSLNGSITNTDGDSKWISSEASRKLVHQMRLETDAVAVGKHTVFIDDPELTVRAVEGRNPFRVIFDTNLNLPHDRKVFTDDYTDKTIIVCSSKHQDSVNVKLLSERGINFLFAETENNQLSDFDSILTQLYREYGIASILAEGGSELHNTLYSHDLIDEMHFFIAPKIIPNGKQSFAGNYFLNKKSIKSRYNIINHEITGGDIHLTLIRNF